MRNRSPGGERVLGQVHEHQGDAEPQRPPDELPVEQAAQPRAGPEDAEGQRRALGDDVADEVRLRGALVRQQQRDADELAADGRDEADDREPEQPVLGLEQREYEQDRRARGGPRHGEQHQRVAREAEHRTPARRRGGGEAGDDEAGHHPRSDEGTGAAVVLAVLDPLHLECVVEAEDDDDEEQLVQGDRRGQGPEVGHAQDAYEERRDDGRDDHLHRPDQHVQHPAPEQVARGPATMAQADAVVGTPGRVVGDRHVTPRNS